MKTDIKKQPQTTIRVYKSTCKRLEKFSQSKKSYDEIINDLINMIFTYQNIYEGQPNEFDTKKESESKFRSELSESNIL